MTYESFSPTKLAGIDGTTKRTTVRELAEQDCSLPSNPAPHHALVNTTYYRSRLFMPETGINNLVRVAQPLLTLFIRIKSSEKISNSEELRQHLIHELKVFESRALAADYSQQTIFIARFLLCYTLKQIIGEQKWLDHWEFNELFKKDPLLEDTEQNLLMLINHLMLEPMLHIELLELCYLCISLGYENKSFDVITDQLFQSIRQQRGDHKKLLFSTPIPLKKTTLTQKSFPLWLSLLIAVMIFLITETCFNYALNITTKPLANRLHAVLQQQVSQEMI